MKTVSNQTEQKLILTILESPFPKVRNFILANTIVEDFGTEWGVEARELMESQLSNGKGLGNALDFADSPSLSEETQDWVKADQKRRRVASKFDMEKVETLVDKLRVHRRLRAALVGLERASSILTAKKVTDKDIGRFRDCLEDMLMKVDEGFDDQPMLHIGRGQSLDDLKELTKKVTSKRKDSFVSAGLPAFNIAYKGFARGNVVTLSANPGGGKTALALNVAMDQALDGLKVLYCSMEMSELETLDRCTAKIANINHDLVRTGKLKAKHKARIRKSWSSYRKKVRKAGGRFTIWDIKNAFTPQQLEIAAKPFKYDCIVIDYITLFDSKHLDTWKMQMEYSRFLKKMAKRLNCVVIIITQLNEDDEIKYGKSIKENTDYWFHWRYGEEEEEEGQTELKTGKARHSRKRKITLYLSLDIMTITGSVEDAPLEGGRKIVDVGGKKKEKKGKGKRYRQQKKSKWSVEGETGLSEF